MKGVDKLVWHRINEELYNPHLTVPQNIANGCNIPPEGMPVYVYDCDKPCPLIARLVYNEMNKRLEWLDTVFGYPYGGVRYTLWTPVDTPSQDEQEALYET